jgi:hypothetical protein
MPIELHRLESLQGRHLRALITRGFSGDVVNLFRPLGQIDHLVDPNLSNIRAVGGSARRESQEQGVSITNLLLDL